MSTALALSSPQLGRQAAPRQAPRPLVEVISRTVLLVGEAPEVATVERELRRRGFNVERSVSFGLNGMRARPSVALAWAIRPAELRRLSDALSDGVDQPPRMVVASSAEVTDSAAVEHWARLEADAQAPTVVAAVERAYSEIASAAWADYMITADPVMHRLLEQAARAAASDATMLIEGESGTGKEVLARAVHRLSPRREGTFVGVNCAALPEGLLESELFGHEKGAFTGATGSRAGRFELADGGTLLLDEAGEMPLALQAKLLRVLEQRAVERVGGMRPIPFDARVITATNRDLEGEVRAGRFRLDLFYRLNVLRLVIPPLRERPLDIRALATSFLPSGRQLTPAAMTALERHAWPGNVRELMNVIQRASILGEGPRLDVEDLALAPPARAEVPSGTLEEVERMCIFSALEQCAANRTHAAKLLGISIRTLRNRLAAYRQAGIPVPGPGGSDL